MMPREGNGPFCPLASRKPVPPLPTEVLLFPEWVYLACYRSTWYCLAVPRVPEIYRDMRYESIL